MTEAPKTADNAHSPLPWAADPDWREGYSWNIHIVQQSDPYMRICFMTSDGPAQANADLIVEAVNSYARLRASNEEMRKALEEINFAVDLDEARRAAGVALLALKDTQP